MFVSFVHTVPVVCMCNVVCTAPFSVHVAAHNMWTDVNMFVCFIASLYPAEAMTAAYRQLY